MAKPIEIKTDSKKKTLKRRIRKWNFKGIISIYIKTILHIKYKKKYPMKLTLCMGACFL